jgi:hypothetical protein
MTTDARGLEQARATARDEQGVLNLYYPKASAHAASDVLPKGDEWSVFEKFKQAGAFAKEGGR